MRRMIAGVPAYGLAFVLLVVFATPAPAQSSGQVTVRPLSEAEAREACGTQATKVIQFTYGNEPVLPHEDWRHCTG